MAWIAVVAVAVVMGGCGGGSRSIDDLVADRYDVDTPRCQPVGITEIGKLYSCQNGRGGTVCVMRDGDDLFSGLSEAARAGIAC